jgi:group II intron reverse transcriptase/maturase
MGREKSDDRVVPQGRRKAVPTTPLAARGGKAITVSETAMQLELQFETADSPQGNSAERDGSGSPRSGEEPRSNRTTSNALPPITLKEIASERNLKKAWRRVASNKGAAGPDRESVVVVREHLDDVLATLRRELLNGSYQAGAIRRVWIPKAGGGQRGLGIPNVVDRIVQQATAQCLSPHYEPTFHRSSHGFRPGRSCHTAIAEARQHLASGYDWVVDFDLSKFFDRVHHERLLARLAQRIEDARVLRLIRQMLKAKVVMPDGVVVSTTEGAPQGGPLSPLLSNIVLDELDRELDRRGHRFVRYADDCNVYVRSERAGQRVMASITRFIERRLRLQVNADKSAVARPEERHFVGFRLQHMPRSGNVVVMLSRRSRERIYDKIRELTPRTWGKALVACIQGLNAYLRGWIEFFRICSSRETRTLQRIDSHVRRRLRAIVLRHWKRLKTARRRLRRLGVAPRALRKWLTKGRSWWALSRTSAVEKGLSNAWLATLGLVSVEEQWRMFHGKARSTWTDESPFSG